MCFSAQKIFHRSSKNLRASCGRHSAVTTSYQTTSRSSRKSTSKTTKSVGGLKQRESTSSWYSAYQNQVESPAILFFYVALIF